MIKLKNKHKNKSTLKYCVGSYQCLLHPKEHASYFLTPIHLILYINSLSPSVRLSVCDHWTQRKVTVDVEKSDGKKIRRP